MRAGARAQGTRSAPRAAPPPPRGRGQEFLRALESSSSEIRDPVAKLRYIRASLGRYEKLDRCVSHVPSAPLRSWLYRWMSVEGLGQALADNPLGATQALPRRAQRGVWVGRLSASAVVAAAGMLVGNGAYRLLLRPPPPPVMASTPAAAGGPEAADAAASATVPPARGVAPERIWRVEQGEGWELYSNGLRIDTSFAVSGEPRAYRTFVLGTGALSEVIDQPRGILFHTSESDIWPLEAAFNENLRDSSHRLLRYLRRNRVYHYLIDRFGRVYRVVEEDSKANHAGHSIWSQGRTVYLSLNNAFLGVAFETRWEGGLALPITQAQFAAGRTLTQYLRQSYEIAPEMCVAHGLTSVNPQKHLIGHHLDWSRGFPFEEFGLPDQYRRPAPSVELFGFGYDEHFLGVLGEPWPGVLAAERSLAAAAAREAQTVEEVRRERRDLYDDWIAEQARDEEARNTEHAASRADRAPTPGPRGG